MNNIETSNLVKVEVCESEYEKHLLNLHNKTPITAFGACWFCTSVEVKEGSVEFSGKRYYAIFETNARKSTWK